MNCYECLCCNYKENSKAMGVKIIDPNKLEMRVRDRMEVVKVCIINSEKQCNFKMADRFRGELTALEWMAGLLDGSIQ